MKYNYIFYETDESFDYGDWAWGGTCHQTGYHGFSIDIDKEDNIDISTLEGFGDFATEIEKIKTLDGLKAFIENHLEEVEENPGDIVSNQDTFIELIEIIKDKLNVTQSN